MTLHLLKNSTNPLAIEVLRSEIQTEAPVVVMLSPSPNVPQLPGVTVYHLGEPEHMEKSHSITYSRLIEIKRVFWMKSTARRQTRGRPEPLDGTEKVRGKRV
jgi:hypothetical protein